MKKRLLAAWYAWKNYVDYEKEARKEAKRQEAEINAVFNLIPPHARDMVKRVVNEGGSPQDVHDFMCEVPPVLSFDATMRLLTRASQANYRVGLHPAVMAWMRLNEAKVHEWNMRAFSTE